MTINEWWNRMFNNRFFVFEGIDGSGKTTVSKGVAEDLKKKGYNVILTREPGEFFYNTVGGFKVTSKQPVLEEFYYLIADRAVHNSLLNEWLKDEKTIVICDRYCYSTYAYQGVKLIEELGDEKFWNMCIACNQPFIMPHTVYFIDTPPQVAYDRIKKRNEAILECFEHLNFMTKCYELYKRLEFRYPLVNRWYNVFHGVTPEEQVKSVNADILKQILKK
jgi:dTMP kinase